MIVPNILSGHKGPVYSLCQGPEHDSFLSGSGDGSVVRWKIGSDVGKALTNVDEAVFSCYVHNNDLLFCGTEGGSLHAIDLTISQEIHHFKIHHKGIFRIIQITDRRIACAGGDGSLSLWDIDRKNERWNIELFRQIPLIEEKLRDLQLSPNADQLVIAGGDGRLRILETGNFNEIAQIDAHVPVNATGSTTGASSVIFHPSKPVLISGGKDGYLRFWRTDGSFQPVQEVAAHKGAIYRIAFDRSGSMCATCSRDRTIKIWDANGFDPLQRLDRSMNGHTHSVNDILWMDGSLVSASDDRSIRYWPIDAGAARTFGSNIT